MSNHRPDPRELAELLHDDWADGKTGGYALAAAGAVRRRHRIGIATSTLGGAALAVAVALALRSPAPQRMNSPVHPETSVETISDAELLRELRGQPVLVVPRSDGSLNITLLDSKASE